MDPSFLGTLAFENEIEDIKFLIDLPGEGFLGLLKFLDGSSALLRFSSDFSTFQQLEDTGVDTTRETLKA